MRKVGLLLALSLCCVNSYADEYKQAIHILDEIKKVNYSAQMQQGKISKAVKLLQTSCSKGNKKACSELDTTAILYLSVMPKASISMLDVSCKYNDAKGCKIISDIFFQGVQGSVTKNPRKAYKFLKKACQLGDKESCTSLGQRYLRGDQVTKNVTEGIKLLKNSCNSGSSDACVVLGYAYNNNKNGIKKNESKIVKYLKKACDMHNGKGCYGLGLYYAKGKKNLNQAKNYFSKACTLKVNEGCKLKKALAKIK